jgi:Flp pilus assembly protein TadG
MSGNKAQMFKFLSDRSGGFAINFAVLLVPLLLTVGFAVDTARLVSAKTELQDAADAAALAAAKLSSPTAAQRTKTASDTFLENSVIGQNMAHLQFITSAPTASTVSVTVAGSIAPMFMQIAGYPKLDVAVRSDVLITAPSSAPCITVLANSSQALLVNSGANLDAKTCEIHVASTANPAMITNAGTVLDVKKICVQGSNIINNGPALPILKTSCATTPDQYAGKFTEPAVPNTCNSSGVYGSGSYTLQPGVQCSPIFHSNSVVTFAPGLHIIKGQMILDAGSTIIAKDVTFYFPDTGSEIRANGALTVTAIAPTSGPYKGVLMFEKTSDAVNNSQKRQYVFNGSNGEKLEGVIYLPNRDVVYNSTTNVSSSKINIVANTMIVNSANWSFKPYDSAGGSGNMVSLIK